MPKKLLLREEAQTATKTPTGRWRAILAVPGQGSSGKYSAAMLKEFGPRALPKGMKAYITHDEKRDPRDLLGSYPDGAFWDENEGTDGALVSELEPLPSRRAFVEEVAPHVALSLFAMGSKDEEGNITELLAHRTNGVDMVGYGGLEGSSLGEQIFERAETLLEAARTADLAVERKEESMTPEEIKALAEALKGALAESLAPVLTFIAEQAKAETARVAAAEAAAKGTPGEPTVKEAVAKFATDSKAITDAELLPTQEAALLAVAEVGGDITSLLEDAKAIKTEALALNESATPSTTARRFESAGSDKESYGLGMFGGR